MTIDASAVARVLGVTTRFTDLRAGRVLFLPQRIAVFGQGRSDATYSSDKFQATSAQQVGERVGYGSPLYLAAREMFPANGDGVGTLPVTFYPLQDDQAAVAATGSISTTGTATENGTLRILVGGVPSARITVTEGDGPSDLAQPIADALDAVLAMPVSAAVNVDDVDLTAKWKGASGNAITLDVEGEVDGIVVSFTSMADGATNPEVGDALDKIGNVWETMVLNCLDIDDTDALDAYQTKSEGRWGPLDPRPFVAFTGNTETTVANATTIMDARPTDRVNAQLVAPGSPDMPWVVAARQLARIAPRAQNNPPRDYAGLRADRLTPGPDGDQWDYAQRDQAVKAGSSTIEVVDGVVNVSDVITAYKPEGEEPPAYRYVVDIVKLTNVVFNLNLIFKSDQWKGAPLIPDDQPTVNRAAKKPKHALAELAGLTESLASNAIISDPAFSLENAQAWIDDQNPKRLNVRYPVKLSGNTNIIDAVLEFGFYFGTAPEAA